jgi:hypothetical protein
MHHLAILRSIAVGALVAVVGASAFAKDTYDIRDIKDATDLAKVRAQLDVNGTLLTKADDKDHVHSLSVSAVMEYAEHRLAAYRGGRSALRHYDKAEATIRIDRGEHQPQLAASKRLVAVHVTPEKTHLFCPTAWITRDELDLIDIPGNSAVLPLLLPVRPVEVGVKWAVPGDAVAMLLGIDVVSSTDVQCTLTEVTTPPASGSKLAQVRFAGHVDGSANGAATEIAVQGSFDYDLKARRITRLDLHINESRAISQMGPGLKVSCRLQLTAQTLPYAPQVSDDRMILLARSPEPPALLLACESADGYRFLHSRQWQVVDQRQGVTALRLFDRGELLAHCNVALAKEPGPGESRPTTLMAYQQEVRKSLDKRFGKQISADEVTTKTGLKGFVVVAEGEAQEMPVRWVHYLLTHPSGKQAGLVFTLEPKQAERFGTAAEDLVNTFRIDAQATTAAAPGRNARMPAVSRLPERTPRVVR